MESDEYKSTDTTYKDFWKTFEDNFKKQYVEDDALYYLKHKKQEKESFQTFVTNWRQIAAAAEFSLINNDRIALDYLKPLVNPALLRKLREDLNEPTTFEEWVKKAIEADNKWR